MISNIKHVSVSAATVLSASCGNQGANQPESKANAPSGLASPTNERSKNLALLAAAEEFDTRTESSFSADSATREMVISKTSVAIAKMVKFASSKLTTQVKSHLANIQNAQKQNATADLAIESNEAFRTLVSSVGGKQAIPVNLSLLDYAGFRVDADAQAIPARFAEMKVAVLFAQQQRAGIKSRQEIAKLAARFSASLDHMDLTVRSGDIAKARAAAKVELHMVDELETAFSQ